MTSGERTEAPRIAARAYTLPTDGPEADGTLRWDSTTCVIVQVRHAGMVGLGYTYSDPVVAPLVEQTLGPVVDEVGVTDPEACWVAMLRAVRNLGRQGLAAHAISAVDVALWDLKARLQGLSLQAFWGRVRPSTPAYGSGGFTSYDDARLQHQQALYFAQAFADLGVTWLEEPVTSDDIEGLRMVRDGAPTSVQIAAGEYGYHLHDFRRLIQRGAVDVLQADVTRCLGFTGIRKVAALCEAHGMPLSAHCAPSLSATVSTSLPAMRHIERFHDHVRMEEGLFEGVPELSGGELVPDPASAGHGLSLQRPAAAEFQTPDQPGATHATRQTHPFV